MKKKIVILAYDFPPYLSIGAMRPYSWYKYLDKNEWEVSVVTRNWDSEIINAIDYVKPSKNQKLAIDVTEEGIIYRLPFKPNLRDKIILKYGLDRFAIIRKLLTLFYNYGKHLSDCFDNTANFFKETDKLFKENNFDLIIASGEPFILFKYANKLSRKHHTPWVADYRDGWTTNQEDKTLSFQEKVMLNFYKRKEASYLKNVKLITTASPSYKIKLSSIFPSKKIEVIFNGYFTKYQPKTNITKHEVFTMAYVGTLYPHQQLEMFLEGFSQFIKENKLSSNDVQVLFYGMQFYPEQIQRVKDFSLDLNQYFKFTERLSYKELLLNLNESDLLLLLTKRNINWLNAKIFDYIAANKRVLLVENDKGILEQILNEVGNSSYFCDTAIEVKDSLSDAYKEFQLNGYLKNTNSESNQYSREKQAEKLSTILIEELKD